MPKFASRAEILTAPDSGERLDATPLRRPNLIPPGTLGAWAEVADGERAQPDGPAAPARAGTQETPRGGQAHLRRSGGSPGMLRFEDQPCRDRAGVGLAPRRPRHARAIRRALRAAGEPGPAGPRLAPEGLVACVQRRRAASVRHLLPPGSRGLRDPDLR